MALVKDDKRKKVGIGIGGGSLLAILYSIDPVHFVSYFNEALGHQLVQFSLVFAGAAWIHRRGMKKDMGAVTDAINNLAVALGTRIDAIEGIVSKLHLRVDALEKPKE
jgi:hypothetical protein